VRDEVGAAELLPDCGSSMLSESSFRFFFCGFLTTDAVPLFAVDLGAVDFLLAGFEVDGVPRKGVPRIGVSRVGVEAPVEGGFMMLSSLPWANSGMGFGDGASVVGDADGSPGRGDACAIVAAGVASREVAEASVFT
jgi:hypothetical protein